MLEVLFLFRFCKWLASIAAQKGRTVLWAGLGVCFWVGGEVFGFVLGGLLGLEMLVSYGLALALAAAGALTAWLVVKGLPQSTLAPSGMS